MRKRRIAALLLAAVMGLTACAKNPESSVVKNKNMDNMIAKAQESGEDVSDYADVAKEVADHAQSYVNTVEDASLGVSVNIDADVVIPETTALSVYRVTQKKIDQAFLDRVKEVLAPDTAWYEGQVLETETKASLAECIQGYKDMIAEVRDSGNSEEYKESYIAEYEEGLARVEAEYENAPADINLLDYPSDGQICSVQDKYNQDPDNEYWSWLYQLTPEAEAFFGINDAADGDYVSLFMQNNADYGNCLRYKRNKKGYEFTSAVVVDDGIVEDSAENTDGSPITADMFPSRDFEGMVFEKISGEEATISEEEARQQADSLLGQLGLSDYQMLKGGRYYELPRMDWLEKEDNVYFYRDVYEFQYMRNIDGVFVDNSAGTKLVDEWRGDSYVKQMWDGEAVIVFVNDTGIVGFKYCSPLSVDETVVEKSSLKSFEEIKAVFEKMILIQNASTEDGEKVSIDIDTVELVYARLSEKDRFDSGILVPIWNFKGTKVDEYGYETTGSIMSINAIDGSVIDWSIGY
ncbi:MAG: DUF6034 family protein [Clostridium sp.]|nr:DUF6034 family protein [Clostridium sp.]